MNPWLRRAALGIVGVLAVIGLVAVLLNVGLSFFVSSCEQAVLARAVSPRGDRAAEHVRLVCDDPLKITHTISIGPAERAPRETYHGYQFYEDDGRRQDEISRIMPAVLWWTSEDQLNVIYPAGAEYVDGIEIAGVTLRAASRRELE